MQRPTEALDTFTIGNRSKEFVPMNRRGICDDVAPAALLLLSDEASHVTDALIDISGKK